jgi:tripartite-type tricarboxylate transporter receptor subunit TctC
MSSTRPGEGTLLGADFVAKPPPDVHTLCLVVTGHVINPSLCKNQPFDTVKDLAGVSRLVTRPIVIEATPGLPASNLKKSIELAKKQPDKLTCASPGSGSPTHLAGELRKAAAGIDMPRAP